MPYDKPKNEIKKLENEIYELGQKLIALRKETAPVSVKNYALKTLEGDTTLAALFGGKQFLFAIHNMGQGCRYCTLWADGINGFLTHLEDKFSVVLLSHDAPDVQRRFANMRHWRFKMASHGGGEYIREQDVGGGDNTPGIVVYERRGNEILRRNSAVFGPGDVFCSLWHIISLAGFDTENWTPQYHYWKRPQKMDDGGQNLQD